MYMKFKEKRKCLFCDKEYIAHNWRAQVCSHKCHLNRRRKWSAKNGDRIRAKQRHDYHNGGKVYYRQYEKTPTGFLMRLYRNMTSRINGIQKAKFHLYKGKYLLPKEDFYKWAHRSKKFKTMYKTWKDNNYDRKLTPSVDRIDSSRGYSTDNMEWVTHSENSRRGQLSRFASMI